MSRRAVAWLLTLPLAFGGAEVAHAIAYGSARPGDGLHGYLSLLPLAAGVAVAALLVGLVAAARGGERPSARPFALVGPLAFLLQEHLERWHAPWQTLAEPAVLLGLALQIPFALLAYAVALSLFTAAHAVVRALREARPRLRPRALAKPFVSLVSPRPRLLCGGCCVRGPPRLASLL
jgi:hypothetical protein